MKRVDFVEKPAVATMVGRRIGQKGELYLALIVYSDFGVLIMHTVMHCLGKYTMAF